MRRNVLSGITLVAIAVSACQFKRTETAEQSPDTLRVATYNVEDLRTVDLAGPGHSRLDRIVEQINSLDADVVLVNEVAYDGEGSPGFVIGDAPGQNGRRLADRIYRAGGREYTPIMFPSNTGIHSGFDLNNDGILMPDVPPVPPPDSSGIPGRQTREGRDYGNDSWGFGTFPGQYGMSLLVDAKLVVVSDSIRTFKDFIWRDMPENMGPFDPASGDPWYSGEEWLAFRLSSKSHWDIPIEMPSGRVIHALCSHPTPPAFDGAEERNKRRNHDEIRFWGDYIDDFNYIVDDAGRRGGLRPNTSFVILGDLNADPDEGSAIENPVGRFLIDHPAIEGEFVPVSEVEIEGLDPDDTARFGIRADYVLPSIDLAVVGGGVVRPSPGTSGPSDHFPVWIDLVVGAE